MHWLQGRILSLFEWKGGVQGQWTSSSLSSCITFAPHPFIKFKSKCLSNHPIIYVNVFQNTPTDCHSLSLDLVFCYPWVQFVGWHSFTFVTSLLYIHSIHIIYRRSYLVVNHFLYSKLTNIRIYEVSYDMHHRLIVIRVFPTLVCFLMFTLWPVFLDPSDHPFEYFINLRWEGYFLC